MGFLKVVIVLGGTLITNFAMANGGVCSGHLRPAIYDKLLEEVNKLNPEIIKNSSTPEQIYIDLKNEEAHWMPRGYLDYSRPVTENIKANILSNYKLQTERMSSERDFSLFYLNQVRFLYIRVSKLIYERIMSSATGSILDHKMKSYVKEIITQFFTYDLNSVEITAENFKQTLARMPWLTFPWYKALDVIKEWEAMETKGPRELDAFIANVKQNPPQGLTRGHIDMIEKSIRSRDRRNEVCCKSAHGCSNCPLNRKFLFDPKEGV